APFSPPSPPFFGAGAPCSAVADASGAAFSAGPAGAAPSGPASAVSGSPGAGAPGSAGAVAAGMGPLGPGLGGAAGGAGFRRAGRGSRFSRCGRRLGLRLLDGWGDRGTNGTDCRGLTHHRRVIWFGIAAGSGRSRDLRRSGFDGPLRRVGAAGLGLGCAGWHVIPRPACDTPPTPRG